MLETNSNVETVSELEKQEIIEFLKSSDSDIDFSDEDISVSECIELLMEKISELELDYSIISTAFVNGVNPDRFDDFHDEVMNRYETIEDGDEIPESVLDQLAFKFK